jgi:hypothetical protein
VKFGPNVPKKDQLYFLQRLLPITNYLAVEQTDLGLIHHPKFEYKLVLKDPTPIQEKPIIYPPHVEAWLDEQIDIMLKTGRISELGPEEPAPMVTALVLVPEGQTGQDYRICQNLIPVNKRTPELQQPCGDTRRVL